MQTGQDKKLGKKLSRRGGTDNLETHMSADGVNFQRLRLSVEAAAEAENTSRYRKTPAACQPGEERGGVAYFLLRGRGKRAALATGSVSARGQAPAQTESGRLSPAPSGSFQEEPA
ncbi:hypothetical protein EYF80_015857 [Liparis tanakae]|uniref:Uncharacterized protein n=1 Tax=Liparis tanakae TaxID=230148 RepID=A0A4Z2I7L7_9TELE|nr:hypothetical protein EYF80_015857 [Liparis tanakae]